MWRRLRFVLHCSREQTRESRAESTVKYILAQIKEDFRGACKGNRPFQEAVNLFLVLAEFLLQRTGNWFLGTVGWHSHWNFTGWLHQNYKNMQILCLYLWLFIEHGGQGISFYGSSEGCCRFDRTFQMYHFLLRGRVHLCPTFLTLVPPSFSLSSLLYLLLPEQRCI